MANNGTTPRELCSYCERVPLNIQQVRNAEKETIKRFTEGHTKSKVTEWDIGTLGWVWRSNCKLCRFVRAIFYEDERTTQLPGRRWENPETPLSIQWTKGNFGLDCFTVEIDFRVDAAFCLMPSTSQSIDFGRLRAWIDKSHHSKLIQDAYPKLHVLRLIDVRDMCIVETNTVHPYVALSYVWGSAVSLRLTTSNKADFIQPGALRQHQYSLPRTINDAIFLVQRIGERYLWCDALCLLQDDPDDVSRGVKTMDLVYERAELTIVAACGHSADAGLPGWRGKIDFETIDRDLNKWLDTSTWIVWYKRSPRGVLSLIWDKSATSDFPYDDNKFVSYRKRRAFQSPVALPFATSRTQPTESLRRVTTAVPKYPMLQFWTLSAFFNIRAANNVKNLAFIVDKLGTPCGALYLDALEGSTFFGSAKPYELIAVSENSRLNLISWLGPTTSALPKFRKLFDTACYYNVMVLMWSDGLAERRGIGFVRRDDFITKSLPPGVSWKEIVLS
ncbi:hypothetical protein ONZ43_g4024 [Nemania bipapillata]|uniref:Uncharacterized protein n=1 Tax=Nemania bipapillata TaxID=110536 RepID=A0ACC2IT06_9PEZI|nr:hypothetical protein ONZ43_g4024 [Nemania bipapillata]